MYYVSFREIKRGIKAQKYLCYKNNCQIFRTSFRYKLFRFYPNDKNASKLIFSTFEEVHEGTEIWSITKNQVDVMVTREKLNEFDKMSKVLQIPNRLLVDDIERYTFLEYSLFFNICLCVLSFYRCCVKYIMKFLIYHQFTNHKRN